MENTSLDIHVFAQAITYFLSVVCGLVVAIPLGLTTANFKGNCLLYADCDWQNRTFFEVSYSHGHACDFPVYLSVSTGILYAAVMGGYYIYALTKKDPNIGSKMWVLPRIVISSLATVTFFVAACIITVGFKMFCDSLVSGKDEYKTDIKSCVDGERARWHERKSNDVYDSSTYYGYLHASQGAAWAIFLVWCVQTGLSFLRFYRNRRLLSQGMPADSAGGSTVGNGRKAEDMINIATVEPSA